MFGLSRTVGDNHLVTRKLVQVVKDLARRDELRAGNVSLVIRGLVSHVDNNRLFRSSSSRPTRQP